MNCQDVFKKAGIEAAEIKQHTEALENFYLISQLSSKHIFISVNILN